MVHAKDEDAARRAADALRAAYTLATHSARTLGTAGAGGPAMSGVPKVELHVHLEGTAPPDLIRRIAERNGLAVPEGTFAAPGPLRLPDFLDFLDTYDKAASVIRTGEDYRDITYEYLVKCAARARSTSSSRRRPTTRGSWA